MPAFGEIAPAVGRALFGSAVQNARELRDADELMRRAVPTSRRLSFVSLRGGTGCSETAAAVAAAFARRRPGRVLAVDGGAGRPIVGLAGAVAPGEPVVEQRSRRRRTSAGARRAVVSTAWQATAHLPVGAGGLHVVTPEQTGLRPASPEEWAEALEPVARYFDIVVGDWGHRPAQRDLGAAVQNAHAVALVARADRFALEEAISHVDAIRAHSGRQPFIVAVDVDDVGRIPSRVAASWGLAAVHYLPRETHPRAGGPAAPATRTARIRLAATLLAASVAETHGRGATPPRTRASA